MNNDLISREALKKAICEKGIKGYEEYNQGLATALDLIDLAPTVAVDCKDCDGYEAGYSAGLKDAERPQGEYETACNVLLSLEQIVRSSYGWEDSAVEAVHNAVQTAIKCMHKRPQGEWIFRKGVTCGGYYKCNKCGEVERAEKNYCPNCGALMKGGAE